MMENPIKMDDLGVPLFSETSIYSANQFRQLRQLDIFTSDLGILSDPGSAKKIQRFQRCPRRICPSRWIIFPNVKIKKKCLQPNHHLSLFGMKHSDTVRKKKKKNTSKLHQGGSNSIRLLLAALLPGIQQNMPASTVGTLRLES